MKIKSALKQSTVSAKLLAPVCAALLILLIKFPSPLLAIITGVLVLSLIAEVYNILHINRRARQNKTYLEERIR